MAIYPGNLKMVRNKNTHPIIGIASRELAKVAERLGQVSKDWM